MTDLARNLEIAVNGVLDAAKDAVRGECSGRLLDLRDAVREWEAAAQALVVADRKPEEHRDDHILSSGTDAVAIAARTPEEGDAYEADIHRAAVRLLETGLGLARYRTHVTSGTTYWRMPGAERALRVDRDGNIDA